MRLLSLLSPKAIGYDPSFASAHTILGIALERLGDYAEVKHHYYEALQIDPDQSMSRRNLERAYLGLEGRALDG